MSRSALETALGGNCQAASTAHEELQARGLSTREVSEAAEISLTADGTRVSEAILQSRTHGAERWDRVERAIISDLIEHETRHADDWGVTEVDGRKITGDERTNAMERLSGWGYLRGVGVAQSDGFERIDVRPKASQVAGIDGLLAEFHSSGSPGPSYTYNTSTNLGNNNVVGGIQTGGEGNTLNVGTVSVEERAELLRLLGGLSAAMDASNEDVKALRDEVEAIRAEVESAEPSREGLRTRIGKAIVTAGANQALAFALALLAQMLGIVS